MDDDRNSHSEAGKKGGEARAAALSDEERREIDRRAAQARWSKPTDDGGEDAVEDGVEEVLEPAEDMPIARWRGTLNIVGSKEES